MGLLVAQMTSQIGMRDCYSAVTSHAEKVLHLAGFGLEPGCDASFMLLQARDTIEAIRLRANRLMVWKKGRLLAQTPEVVAALSLPGRAPALSGARTVMAAP
jgi:cytosine deaminase